MGNETQHLRHLGEGLRGIHAIFWTFCLSLKYLKMESSKKKKVIHVFLIVRTVEQSMLAVAPA